MLKVFQLGLSELGAQCQVSGFTGRGSFCCPPGAVQKRGVVKDSWHELWVLVLRGGGEVALV